jgi:hypothetical protein
VARAEGEDQVKPSARLRRVIISRRLEDLRREHHDLVQHLDELVGESLRLGRSLRRVRQVMGLALLITLLGLLLLGSA